MLGLSESEMYFGDLDFIEARLEGFLMLKKFDSTNAWRQARMVAFVTARGLGATKAKTEQDFIKIDEPVKKSALSTEQLSKMFKEL